MSPSKLTMEVWPITDPGQPGGENEDTVLIYQPDDPREARLSGNLYVVADGAGGGARGELASQYAARRIMHAYYTGDEPDLGLRLREAVEAANRDLYAYAQSRPELVKLNTTVVAAVIRGEQLSIAWVGDSRAYVIREGVISQVTQDHTLVQQLLDEGAITPAEALDHPRRDVVLRVLGAEEDVQVDVVDTRLTPDDVLLICTDGLTRAVKDDQIAQIVGTSAPRTAAETLIQKALDRGINDNVSVIATLVRDGGPPLVTDIPHTWDGTPPTFEVQQTLPVPPVEGGGDQSWQRPTVRIDKAALKEAQGEPPLPVGTSLPPADDVDPRAPTTTRPTWRSARREGEEGPPMESRTEPAPVFSSPVQPAPAFPGGMPPQERQAQVGFTDDDDIDIPDMPGELTQMGQPTQPPPRPVQPTPLPPAEGYPPQQGWGQQPPYPGQEPPPYQQMSRPSPSGQPYYPQEQSGARGYPRGYQPSPGYEIDPVTGLPPVPQGPSGPAGYQSQYGGYGGYPPQGGYRPQQQGGGIPIGMFAAFGILAILLTVVLVFLLVNPLGWNLPFGGGNAGVADVPTVDVPPPPTESQPTAEVNVEEPAAAVPTETPTQIPVAPPGMALIEGGAFTRGVAQDEVDAAVLVCIQEDTSENNQLCYREYFEDAQPVEEITLSPFYVDITEVTNVAYAQCVAAEVCTPPSNTQFYADPAFSNHPVVFVSWAQAGTYCQFVGKRLPTEAEWEKAARWDPLTGESLVYPWGDNYEAGRANTLSAGQGGTSAVNAFEGDRSTAGIQGLAGNVTEWVSDWYFPGYNGLGTLNPTGPDAQPLPEPIKVARGGSFVDIQAYARSGHRLSPNQTTQANWLGFRCAADVGTEGSIGQPVAPTPEIPTESAATPVDGEALTPAPTIQPTPANTPVP